MELETEGPNPRYLYQYGSVLFRVVLVKTDEVLVEADGFAATWVPRPHFDDNYVRVVEGLPDDHRPDPGPDFASSFVRQP